MTESIIGLSPDSTAFISSMERFVLQGGLLDTSSAWRNSYTGTAEALLTYGLVKAHELEPQQGRQFRAEFNADGTCYPAGSAKDGWRTPGHRCITHLEDGRVKLEVTVTREEMKERRQQKAWASEQKEQVESADKVVALKAAPLNHEHHSEFESWEGTKDQLQAVGLGVGLDFPEGGSPRKEIRCKCPVGFEVKISRHYGAAERLAGRYRAISWYVEEAHTLPDQTVEIAPGVLQFVCGWGNTHKDIFQGSAEALVAAGLARLDQFPGQIGRNKSQCTYRIDGSQQPTSARDRSFMIKRKSKDCFVIERYVSKVEATLRKAIQNEKDEQINELRTAAKNKRIQLRAASEKLEQAPATIDEFRAEQSEIAELYLQVLFRSVFETKADSSYSFEIEKGDDAYDEIAEAFDAIREVVRNAPVKRNRQARLALEHRRNFGIAQNDAPLQAFLRNAVNGLSTNDLEI